MNDTWQWSLPAVEYDSDDDDNAEQNDNDCDDNASDESSLAGVSCRSWRLSVSHYPHRPVSYTPVCCAIISL